MCAQSPLHDLSVALYNNLVLNPSEPFNRAFDDVVGVQILRRRAGVADTAWGAGRDDVAGFQSGAF